jgi:hypothetical protein
MYIVELKYASDKRGLEDECHKALNQIDDRRYADRLEYDGIGDGLAYGIAFYRKRCKVIMMKLALRPN